MRAAGAAPAAAAAQQGDTQQQQQQQAHTTSAASRRSPSPLPDHLQHEPLEEQWEEWADSEQQQQGTAKKEHRRLFPSLGVNEAGLPMYRGAPNCAFYLGAGAATLARAASCTTQSM